MKYYNLTDRLLVNSLFTLHVNRLKKLIVNHKLRQSSVIKIILSGKSEDVVLRKIN